MSLFDADMCFIEDFDVLKELENYDIVSPKRIQWLSNVDINDLTSDNIKTKSLQRFLKNSLQYFLAIN